MFFKISLLFAFFPDLFDYDEDQTKTTADSSKANYDNLDSNIKTDVTSPQDFMVGFAPEDLSFADEPIKSLPLGNFPMITEHNFEKPVADGNIVYNSSTTETLSKLTVGTETQLVRSVNNTNNNLKSETSTVSLEPSTSTIKVASKDGSKGLKEMLVSGFEDTAKSLEKTAKQAGILVETSVKELGKTYENTKATVSDSLKSLKVGQLKTIGTKDMDVYTEPAWNEKSSIKQVVGESLTLQNVSGESKIKEKVNVVPKIDRNIDLLETGASKFYSDEHSQNYVNAGAQNLLHKTEKKPIGSKTFIKEKFKIDQVTPFANKKLDQSEQTETQSTEKFNEKVEPANTTPGAFKKEILKALEEVKKKSAQSLDQIDASFKTLYDKIIPTVKIGAEITTKKAEMTTKSIPSTTKKSIETTTDKKQPHMSLKSTVISIVDQTEHNKRLDESPGLVILDSKGHSLNSNQFESHNEDELTDDLNMDLGKPTENHLEFKISFENEINVSKKNAPAVSKLHTNITSQIGNQTVAGSTRSSGSTTTAKYERRNLPPVLMIDKVEQLNEAAAAVTTTVMTESTVVKSDADSTTITTSVRTESQTNKKTLPAILGKYKEFYFS